MDPIVSGPAESTIPSPNRQMEKAPVDTQLENGIPIELVDEKRGARSTRSSSNILWPMLIAALAVFVAATIALAIALGIIINGSGGCSEPSQAGRHDWFYYTSTKCAIPDDMAGQQRF
jgi:hypothetical protein